MRCARVPVRVSRWIERGGGLLGGPGALRGELGLSLGLGDRLLLGPLPLRAAPAVGLLGELPAVGEEGGLGQQEDRVQQREHDRVVLRLVRREDRLRQIEAHRRVMHRDEADGEQERSPRLVQGHEGQQCVEPDVHVGEAAGHMHQHVGADHQPQADQAGAGHLAVQHLPYHQQRDDRGQLTPQQPPADTARQADRRQRRRVHGEDGGDDAVPGDEAALVEPDTARDACPEAGEPGRRRSGRSGGRHPGVIGARTEGLTRTRRSSSGNRRPASSPACLSRTAAARPPKPVPMTATDSAFGTES